MQSATRTTPRLVRDDDAVLQRREFDHLGRVTQSRVTAERVEARDIPDLLAFAANEIPVLSSAAGAVARVATRNRDSVWVFRRNGKTAGVYAMLHLSKDGLESLLLGEFDASFPDPADMVATGDQPAAIYKWAVVAPGLASAGICLISRLLQADRYATANLFARPTTPGGRRIMSNLGFQPVRSGVPDLYRYVRLSNRVNRLVAAE